MKPRMKPGKFTAIFGPLSAVALAVAIAVNPIADSFDVTLNNLGGGLGQGELVVNQIKGSENWDTNYVNATLTTAEATRAHGAEVTTKLAQGYSQSQSHLTKGRSQAYGAYRSHRGARLHHLLRRTR